ncbi:MAG: hypothetical protein SGPRY_002117 [Prymnesium sp.]
MPSASLASLLSLGAGITLGVVFSEKLKRLLASLNQPALPCSTIRCTGDDKKDFLSVFKAALSLGSSRLPHALSSPHASQVLTDELVQSIAPYDFPPRAMKYIKRMVEYNVPHGKLTRGLTVVHTLRSIKGRALSDAEFHRASVLGWCVEWLQAMFLVMDDIMDESETRRGQPCWYLKDDVKMNAINDGLLLEAHIYVLLQRYFSVDTNYVKLIELIHETTYQTALGQFLDLTTAEPHKVDFSLFSLDVYSKVHSSPSLIEPFRAGPHAQIVIYKTAMYSFYLPVACGMLLGGITDENVYAQTKEVCMEMGHLFQVQDDFLDCYGDPELRRVVVDRCGWLINTALPICSPEQKRVLEANYAKRDKECEKKVKQVYIELNLEKRFREHEEKSHAKLLAMISQIKVLASVSCR